MAEWAPPMPWPSGTPGGAWSPAWGGYVKLWVRAAIAPGLQFKMGPDPNDRLSSGYVLGPVPDTGSDPSAHLWVDLSCDVLAVDIAGGASAGQGVFAKSDALTAQIRLSDPDGIYDPLWHGGPFSYNGRSRLVPSVPVEVFAEVVNHDDGTWQHLPIFTGTADSWAQDWTPRAATRQTVLIASDATKVWNRYNVPEQPAVGAGDTVEARIARIVAFFQWPGTVVNPPAGSTRTLAATTLAQPGWELLNRAIDDELGAIFLTPAGELRWVNREVVLDNPAPRLVLGCKAISSGAHDVLTDATPAKFDLQMRNDVYAANSGGSQQHASSPSSIDRFGPYGYKRTDLGLSSDAQAAEWATWVVQRYAFPQVGIEDVTMVPALDPASWVVWAAVLDWKAYTDIAHIMWAPPDLPDHVIDGTTRQVGVKHTIDRHRWEVVWSLIAAGLMAESGNVFTLGPHANDHLDAGFVLG